MKAEVARKYDLKSKKRAFQNKLKGLDSFSKVDHSTVKNIKDIKKVARDEINAGNPQSALDLAIEMSEAKILNQRDR